MDMLFEALVMFDMQVADSSLRSSYDEPDGIWCEFIEGAMG